MPVVNFFDKRRGPAPRPIRPKSDVTIAADTTVQRLFQQAQNAQHSEQAAWTKLADYLGRKELKE